jgi:hypothetical protein
MSGHRAIIEAGPGEIRRLCCGPSIAADTDASEIRDAALHAIDDRVGLVDGRPVAVDALWSAALRSLDCATDGAGNGTVVVHPSWWSSSRVGVVTAAAKSMPGDVSVRPRSWLLSQASNADPEAMAVVEIAERVVAIVGAETVGVARGVEQGLVAEEVATVIGEMSSGTTAVVLIDVPSTVAEAPGLAAAIASEVRNSGLGADGPTEPERVIATAVGLECRRRSITTPHVEGACCGRCRLRGGGAGCGRSRRARSGAADDGTDDISGGGPGGTDGACVLDRAARARRAGIGAGPSHVAGRSRSGFARHTITGASRRNHWCDR